MKIMVVGSQGQVGQHLVEQATQNGHEVFAYSRSDCDITDMDQVQNAVNTSAPDVVVNATAYNLVDQAEKDSDAAMAVNHLGVKNLAVACNEKNIPLIHISTDYVFDGKKSSPYIEEDQPNPINEYAKSKYLGEKATQEFAKKHIVLRVSWVFSAHRSNFVKTMLKLGRERDSLNIVNDQIGCPTAAIDIAKAIITIAQHNHSTNNPHWGVYHYSGSTPISWHDFAKVIFDHAKTSDPKIKPVIGGIPSAEYPTPATRPVYTFMNCDKIKKDFGVSPCDWHAALRDTINAALQE